MANLPTSTATWQRSDPLRDAPLRVLIVERSSHLVESLLNPLRKAGHAIRPMQIARAPEFTTALSKRRWDLVLA